MTSESVPTGRQERTVRSARRMSDTEALMWNIEKDPFLSSTFGSITVLDRPPDLDRLRRRLLRMVERIPRLHQRVTPGLGRLVPPEWHDDPDFDIDFHLRHVALPPPGDERALFDLATRMVQAPFDRTRPLWEFAVIDGLDGGRAAMVQKIHHTITDGEGGIRMSEQFIDLTREAEDIPETTITARDAGTPTNVFAAAAETLTLAAQRGAKTLGKAGVGGLHVVASPSRLVRLPHEVVATGRAAVAQLTVIDPAHSPLWADRSLRRRLDVLDVDFDDAYRAAKALGGSLNDLFVAGVAAGAGAYHRSRGTDVQTMRMAMPISTRRDRSAAGNSFVPTRVLVPTGELHPEERFTRVHELLGATKTDHVLNVVERAAGLVNLLPTSMLVRLTRNQVETVDFTTSNVRAADFDLYIAGALILANYPVGPLAGTAFNLTMMSYRGTLNMGLHTDSGAIEDPPALRDAIAEAYAELIHAAGVH